MTGKTRIRVTRAALAGFCLFAVLGSAGGVLTPAHASEPIRIASGPPVAPPAAEEKLTPEERMKRRFPQPVRVGDLVGLPVLDEDDSTIGYVREVVRNRDGKILLVVPYSAWFGWARTEWRKRPVAVPIEVVAILARQINALEMSRNDFDAAPTWTTDQGNRIAADEKTLIALGRR